MKIILAAQLEQEERRQWLHALARACPGHEWVDLAQGQAPAPADVALVANPAPGALAGVSGLRLVQSLWAGVEGLLADETLPADIPLARMVDPMMNAAMAETALWAVLGLHRGFFDYADQQRRAVWHQLHQRRADEVTVGVLGLGAMGGAVCERLAQAGYQVSAWRRQAAADAAGRESTAGPHVSHGPQGLADLLARSQVLINLLPLTPHTRGLLGADLFRQLPRGAAIVNFGRGPHLVEADLLAALDEGALSRAVLDVFATEPLPAAHAFWAHPRITVLPHVAALSDLHSASAVVADNLRRLAEGRPLRHLVDRGRGY